MIVLMIVENAFRPDQRVLKESQALKASGHNVHILAWDRLLQYPETEIVNDISVRRIRVKSGYGIGWKQIFYIWRFWIRTFLAALSLRPDLIICHDFHTLGVGFLLKLLSRRKLWVLYDIHDMYTAKIGAGGFSSGTKVLAMMEKLFTWKFDGFITVGKAMQKYFSRLALHRPFVIVGNWYDPYELTTAEKRDALIKLGLNGQKPCVGYIGSILAHRSIELLGEVARLKPEWNVIVAGGREGAEGDRKISSGLKKAAKAQPNLHLLGWVSEPLKYFALLDVSVYALEPTWQYHSQYAAPNNLFSCIAAGTPMVTTRCGEITEVGTRYRFVEFIDAINPHSIIAAAEKIILGEATAYRKEALRAQGEFSAARAMVNLCELVSSFHAQGGCGKQQQHT
jgi:glycosyltransferase involved in cell wall biosynthesis